MFDSLEPDDVPVERNWRCTDITPECPCKGWLVGPMVVVETHWSGEASKPCHHAITKGVLPCKCQTEPVAKRKLAYVPLFSEKRERIVAICSNGVALKLKPLTMGAPIKLVRTNVPCSPLLYSEWPSYERSSEQTKACQKWTPCDIKPWLLHLWQDRVLTRFFLSLEGQGKTSAVPEPVQPAPETALAAPTSARDNAQTPMPSLIDPRRKRKNAG